MTFFVNIWKINEKIKNNETFENELSQILKDSSVFLTNTEMFSLLNLQNILLESLVNEKVFTLQDLHTIITNVRFLLISEVQFENLKYLVKTLNTNSETIRMLQKRIRHGTSLNAVYNQTIETNNKIIENLISIIRNKLCRNVKAIR